MNTEIYWIALIATHGLVGVVAYFVSDRLAKSGMSTGEIQEAKERGKSLMLIAEAFTNERQSLEAKLQKLAMVNATYDSEIDTLKRDLDIAVREVEALKFKLKTNNG